MLITIAAWGFKPGVGLQQAQTQLSSIAAVLRGQYKQSNAGVDVAVTRMLDAMVMDVASSLYLLLGAVALVLLIACANIATLLLARSTARTREIAVRAALGASRARIVRQLVTESLILSLLSGSVGILLAVWGVDALVKLAPGDIPRLTEARIDGWVLAFTFTVSVIASLLFGLAPALQASRVDLNEALKQGATRSVLGGAAGRLRSALVVAEIAFSMMLLAGAGLLIKSFVAIQNVRLGFRPDHVVVMQTSVPVAANREGRDRAVRFYQGLLPQLSALPGVSFVGATNATPDPSHPIALILSIAKSISLTRRTPWIRSSPPEHSRRLAFNSSVAEISAWPTRHNRRLLPSSTKLSRKKLSLERTPSAT